MMRDVRKSYGYFLMLAVAGSVAVGAWADTLAYWPMNVSTNSGNRYVNDVTGNGYHLKVRAANSGGSAFVDNDIGWNLPPNPDTSVQGAESLRMLQSANEDNSIVTSSFKPVLQVQTGQSINLSEKLSYENDFALEGWFRAARLPNPDIASSNKFIFAYNVLGEGGGWLWSLTVTKDKSSGAVTGYPITIEYNTGASRIVATLVTVPVASVGVLKRWNHYALVCAEKDENTRVFRFYLNGNLHSTVEAVNPVTPVTRGTSFCISGAGSGSAQQSLIGDLTCWRASDVALSSDRLLCGGETVAYWPMNVTTSGAERSVESAMSVAPLTVRAESRGGASFSANDIGWTFPPNRDAGTRADEAAWQSTMKMTSAKDSSTTYTAALAAPNDCAKYLAAALTPTHGFTVEGWYRPSELPDTKSGKQMFVYVALGQYGGWAWSLYGADENGKCAIKIDANQSRSSGRTNVSVATLNASELLDLWNHYALTYDASTCQWSFFLNGVLRGRSKDGVKIEDVSFSAPTVYFSGCSSSTAQSLTGDLSTWRISRVALEPSQFLCGEGVLVWSGAADSIWSNGAQANWRVRGIAGDMAWIDGAVAAIDNTSTTTEIQYGGIINPKEMIVDIDRDVKISSTSSACRLGADCRSITKLGNGSLWFYSTGSFALNQSENTVYVKQGTVRVTNVNGSHGIGKSDSANGFDVYVYDGGRIWFDARNTIGLGGAMQENNARFTVYTNGVFDMTITPEFGSFNIQALSTLDLFGGSFVMPSMGHSLGCLLVRDRVTFGRNPTRTPYVFNPSAGTDSLSWRMGTNTECRVENITEDDAPDVVFNSHWMATLDWETNTLADTACGFRKTGDGTMVLAQRTSVVNTLVLPSRGVSVEEGELRVDCDYDRPTFSVGAGAFLSGTGKVASVVFDSGAGLRATVGQADFLSISGDCSFGATGTVEIRKPSGRHWAKLLKIAGTIAGESNLVNWKVLVNGGEERSWKLYLLNGELEAREECGTLLIFR